MTITITDPSTERLLTDARGPVEVRDAAGRTLGLFTPGRPSDEELLRRAPELFDLEDIERRAALDEPAYTFDEVMAHLRSLDAR